jgi:hypothetical protein
MFQYILSDCENEGKYGDVYKATRVQLRHCQQILAGITSEMLPPFGPNVLPLCIANKDFSLLFIAGNTRNTQKYPYPKHYLYTP